MKLHPILEELVKLGVTIELSYDQKGFMFNLNTGAKSHMYARVTKGNTLALEMRYNVEKEIETFDELCEAFESGYTGFCNHEWLTALQSVGYKLEN